MPEKGLDYSKFDEATKRALSVFDTDSRKGHLSKAELTKAISFFASKDGAAEEVSSYYEGDYIRYHKKDGNIDVYEEIETSKAYNDKLDSPAFKKAEQVQLKKIVNKLIEQYKKEINGKMPDDEQLKNFEISAEHAMEFTPYEGMTKTMHTIQGLSEANKKGYKQTDVANVYQDSNGKYYTFTQNNGFKLSDKDGNYNVKKKLNDKGQASVEKYDKDGNIKSLQARNYQNKVYTNADYCAKVLGLKKYADVNVVGLKTYTNDEYLNMNDLKLYKWNDKSHCFEFEMQVGYAHYF